MTISQIALHNLASLYPDKTAISDGQRSISFGELLEKSELAGQAMAHSSKDRFYLVGGNDIELMKFMYGAALSGKSLICMPDFIPKFAIEMTKYSIGATKDVRKLKHRNANLPGSGNVVVFTSGSTGRPKPMVLSSYMFERSNEHLTDQLRYSNEESLFTSAPVVAAPATFAISMSIGSTVHCMPSLTGDPYAIVDGFNRSGAQRFGTTPSVFEKILDGPGYNSMRGLQTVHLATSPVSERLIRKIRDLNIDAIDLYISTETGPIGYRRILESDSFTLFDGVSVGPGRLSIEAPTLEHAKGTFGRRGVIPFKYPLSNGDFVDMEDGKITSISRNESKIKIAGFAVSAQELINEVLRIPDVTDARVEVVRGEPSDELILYVETDMTTEAVKALLSDRLPWYYVPRVIINGI
jgi:acyl-coenzyme A synthetase/AMP-(fatty) acid ligase